MDGISRRPELADPARRLRKGLRDDAALPPRALMNRHAPFPAQLARRSTLAAAPSLGTHLCRR
jgi:hypothetical protein